MDADRRQWLEALAEACERVLVEHAEQAPDSHYRVVREDVERLLADVRSELDGTAR
jgi:ElaB/YqjD/DUF883 family membrane-anchored ribosome-binding protein